MNQFSLPVIPLAVAVSLCLAFTFIVFFLREHTRRFSNAERESLLPLAEEQPRLAGTKTPANAPPATIRRPEPRRRAHARPRGPDAPRPRPSFTDHARPQNNH